MYFQIEYEHIRAVRIMVSWNDHSKDYTYNYCFNSKILFVPLSTSILLTWTKFPHFLEWMFCVCVCVYVRIIIFINKWEGIPFNETFPLKIDFQLCTLLCVSYARYVFRDRVDIKEYNHSWYIIIISIEPFTSALVFRILQSSLVFISLEFPAVATEFQSFWRQKNVANTQKILIVLHVCKSENWRNINWMDSVHWYMTEGKSNLNYKWSHQTFIVIFIYMCKLSDKLLQNINLTDEKWTIEVLS